MSYSPILNGCFINMYTYLLSYTLHATCFICYCIYWSWPFYSFTFNMLMTLESHLCWIFPKKGETRKFSLELLKANWKVLKLTSVILFRMGFFGGSAQQYEGGQKALYLPKSYTYPAMMKLTVMPQLKKIHMTGDLPWVLLT